MSEPSQTIAIATRTLLAAGYSISGIHRQPMHAELKCEWATRLGPVVPLLVAITDESVFGPGQVSDICRAAQNQLRFPVFVSLDGMDGQLSHAEFFDILGGAVPPWRALSPSFGEQLMTAAQNRVPNGLSGEAWRLFEDLVGDGLELCLGRRVRRMGGQQRGKKVSDMIAVLPNFDVVVVDAKASGSGFDLTWPALRPLVEYVAKQQARQRGGGAVVAALIVASGFQQDEQAVASVAREFLGETRMPLCVISAATLAGMVETVLKRPDLRAAIRWQSLLTGGFVSMRDFDREMTAASSERCESREM